MPRRRSGRRRILILSSTVGHRPQLVAEALRKAFRSRTGEPPEVRVVDFLTECLPATAVLSRFAYRQGSDLFTGLSGSIADAMRTAADSPVLAEAESIGIGCMEQVVASFAPHVIIATAPGGAALAAQVAPPEVPVVDVHPGFHVSGAWPHPRVSVHFVATKEARDELVVRGVPWDRVVVSGIPVDPAHAESASHGAGREAVGRFTVALVVGSQTAVDALEVARGLVATGVDVLVYTGFDRRAGRRFERLVEAGVVRLFDATDDLPRMLSSSDGLVSLRGSAALVEAIAHGIPTVVVGEIPNGDRLDVDFAVNAGFALEARDAKDAVEKIAFLHTHGERVSEMSSNARRYGRAGAAGAVCERSSVSV